MQICFAQQLHVGDDIVIIDKPECFFLDFFLDFICICFGEKCHASGQNLKFERINEWKNVISLNGHKFLPFPLSTFSYWLFAIFFNLTVKS